MIRESKQISIRIPLEWYTTILMLGAENSWSFNTTIKKIIEKGLKDLPKANF